MERGGSLRRRALPWLVVVALAWMAVIDLPNTIRVLPISVGGVMTLAVAGAALAAFVGTTARFYGDPSRDHRASDHGADPGQRFWAPLALLAFLVTALIRIPLDATEAGIQNVAVYAIFIVAVPLVMIDLESHVIDTTLTWVARIAVATSLLFMATELTRNDIFNNRAFALTALVYLAVTVPLRGAQGLARWAPWVVLIAVIVSQSRTALAVALGLVFFGFVRLRSALRMPVAIVSALALTTIAYLLTTQYAPIRDRFIGGDNATVGGVQINTSGRNQFWAATIENWQTSPWFGHGPGSASALIGTRWPQVGHPHNDYLRLLHDFGWVGLALFAVGYAVLLRATIRRVRTLDRPIDWAATLALVAVAVTAITDNVIVYPFVMVGVAVLTGLSLAGGSPTSEARPATSVDHAAAGGTTTPGGLT